MKRVRITYPGAFHHVMNRGYNGNDIFAGNKNKAQFLEFLEGTAKKLKIHLLAYCIMDTHYHLVLVNNHGRVSHFLGQLNGLYGMYYRKVGEGKGYALESRFKSTLIENDSYLIQSLLYLLLDTVRAGIVHSAEAYTWSSINEYFSSKPSEIVDAVFVNELFGSREQMIISLDSMVNKELEIITTKHGEILGNREYMEIAREKHNRRKRPTEQSDGVKRQDERFFEPVQKLLQGFEEMKAVPISGIDTGTYKGKHQRGELLVLLKDKAGLKYREIAEVEIFSDLSFASLRSIYRNMKGKKKKEGGLEKDSAKFARLHALPTSYHRPRTLKEDKMEHIKKPIYKSIAASILSAAVARHGTRRPHDVGCSAEERGKQCDNKRTKPRRSYNSTQALLHEYKVVPRLGLPPESDARSAERHINKASHNDMGGPIQMVEYVKMEAEFDSLKDRNDKLSLIDDSDKLREYIDEQLGNGKSPVTSDGVTDAGLRAALDCLRGLIGDIDVKYDDAIDGKRINDAELKNLRIINGIPNEAPGFVTTLELDFPWSFEGIIEKIQKKSGGVNFKDYVDGILAELAEFEEDIKDGIIKMLSSIEEARYYVGVRMLNADEHGGVGPMAIKLTKQTDGTERSLVYKPRPGGADVIVMDVFKELNALRREANRGPELPTYYQAVTKGGNLISDLIPGRTLMATLGEKDHILDARPEVWAKLGWSEQERGEAKNQLLHLHNVAALLGLTDLHNENLIVDIKNHRIVPIDLESILLKNPTMLSTGLSKQSPETTGLSREEIDIITKARNKLAGTTYRLVPLPTSTFEEWLVSPDNEEAIKKFTDELGTTLIAKFGMTWVDEIDLKHYLKECKGKKLIPKFLVNKGVLITSSGAVIGDLN